MSHLALNNKPELPIQLRYDLSVQNVFDALWAAVGEWNKIRPCFTLFFSENNTNIKRNERTWVDMHNGILYIGQEPESYINYWLLHELGHLLKFGDHIRVGSNPSGYINSEFCEWPNDEYQGVMSYCYYANRLTEQDKSMVLREYPVKFRWWNRIPGLAKG